MITIFVLEHPALTPVALLLLAVICAGAGYLALRARRFGPRILTALTVLSLLPAVALPLSPTSPRTGHTACTVEFSVPTLTSIELVANVALFIPPVFFAALATRRPLFVLAAGSGLSAAIETVQALVPALGRICDTNDWTMNTLGAIVAVLLAVGTIAIANRRIARHSRI
ncbi:VanZ family protein [Amycolatopsis sp. NPDC024027]|uniref:VanZ family protein n=1 Tax=Amycolatopsis sp. NPDC024027 TaxID=3154327 RepID=UPI0033EC916C